MNAQYYHRLKLTNFGYQTIEPNDYFLSALFCVLNDNYTIDELLADLQEQNWVGGNYTTISAENNMITIQSFLFPEPISLPNEKFYEFIEDAKKLKPKPAEIIIYRDNDFNIWIEASNA